MLTRFLGSDHGPSVPTTTKMLPATLTKAMEKFLTPSTNTSLGSFFFFLSPKIRNKEGTVYKVPGFPIFKVHI